MRCPKCWSGLLLAQETRTGWGELAEDGREVWTETGTWSEDVRLITAVQCTECEFAVDFPDGASAQEIYALYPQGRLTVTLPAYQQHPPTPAGTLFRVIDRCDDEVEALFADGTGCELGEGEWEEVEHETVS